ncbi:conserved membrane hypothetical protein [Candidatus Roizmanbacteria bacterium]|nr:conserved membrane hypothetical protein [Candidatus Roizmanbacteria bacterium]
MIHQIIQLLYNALFFITPLIMAKSTSELFEFNKMLFIYAATILIAFFWLTKMVINKKIILKKTPLDIPIMVFFISQVISTIISIDRNTSIFGYYGRFNGGLLSIICYIILYYAFVSNVVNIEKLLKSIIVSSLLVILWAIPGHFGRDLTCLLFTGKFSNSCWDNTTLAFRPELRAFSTLGQPNWLGAYLAVGFFIGLYYLIKKVETRHALSQQIIASIYLFLNFSMILFSRSRSAIFAVIVGLILFISYFSFFIKTNLKKYLIILLFVTVIPIILFKTGENKVDKYLTIKTYQNFFTKQSSPPVKELPAPNTSQVSESFDIRKIVWEGAWKLALKYPLFGTGVETFAYSYNFVRPLSHNLTSEWDYVYNKAHNEYFNYLATTGFIGLGSYLLFIGIFIIYAIKKIKKDILSLSLFVGWLTILITNFFGFSTTTTQLFFYLIPAFIIMGNHQYTKTKKSEKVNTYQWLVIFVIAASTIYLLFSLAVYYIADVNYSYGLKYLKPKTLDYQKAASYFERALKLRKEPVYEDRFSGSLAYLSALAVFQKQDEPAKQIAVLADLYNRKNIQDYPKNVFYWKTRAKNMYYFYLVTNSENELLQGIDALKKARMLSPTDPKIPYLIALYSSMLFDISKNNLDKQNWQKLSLEEINKVVELKSNFREGYLLKGQLLKKYGSILEAKKIFEYILKNFNPRDSEVLKELQTL